MKKTNEKLLAVTIMPSGYEVIPVKEFDEAEGLHSHLESLRSKNIKTGQNYMEFAIIFDKGSVYPATYEAFRKKKKERQDKTKSSQIGDGYLVQYKTKQGELVQESYNVPEDFDWKFAEWEKKGFQEIIILNCAERIDAEYYYGRDVLRNWGVKESLLGSLRNEYADKLAQICYEINEPAAVMTELSCQGFADDADFEAYSVMVDYSRTMTFEKEEDARRLADRINKRYEELNKLAKFFR